MQLGRGCNPVAVLAPQPPARDNERVAYIIPDQSRTEPTAGLPGILAALKALAPERESLERREFAFIQAARALGATWDQIADALGRGAQRRYRELREQFTPPDLDAP